MSKEKQIQKYESKQLLDDLSKMPLIVIETAYLYATNYTLYGKDVTEKWATATQNASALEKAYQKGYYDAMERVKPPAQPEIKTDVDTISRQATYLALVEKGQASKRYRLGETWELNGKEIREVLDALPSAQPKLDE